MIKFLNIVLAITCALSMVGVYALKYQTVAVANEKLALEDKIDRQKSDLSLLKADWAYLNQPNHIEPIIVRHEEALNLQVIDQKQFVAINDIPMRPAIAPDDAALTDLLQSLEAGVDPISVLIEESLQ